MRFGRIVGERVETLSYFYSCLIANCRCCQISPHLVIATCCLKLRASQILLCRRICFGWFASRFCPPKNLMMERLGVFAGSTEIYTLAISFGAGQQAAWRAIDPKGYRSPQ